jgi:hypothetical protein
MVELHSNYTPQGQKYIIDDVYPTDHQKHETIEITQGLTSWSEVGFYIFASEQSGHGVRWVGDHIRPRVCVPDPGIGPSESASPTRLVISGPCIPQTWAVNSIGENNLQPIKFDKGACGESFNQNPRGP